MLGLTADEKDALVAFLNALTDDRVRTQQAPFDHPELLVPDGERGDTTPVKTDASGTAADDFLQVPAVGAAGGPPLAPFPTPHSSTSAPPFDSEPVGSPAPAAVDFDSVARGQTANAQVVITSIGAQPLAVSKVRIDGARAAEFSLVAARRALGPRCPRKHVHGHGAVPAPGGGLAQRAARRRRRRHRQPAGDRSRRRGVVVGVAVDPQWTPLALGGGGARFASAARSGGPRSRTSRCGLETAFLAVGREAISWRQPGVLSRTSMRPSVVRASKTGCSAVAGPRRTEPFRTSNCDP
jgi:hypothetical protein